MPPIDTQVPPKKILGSCQNFERQPGVQNKREPKGETPSIEHRVLRKGLGERGEGIFIHVIFGCRTQKHILDANIA